MSESDSIRRGWLAAMGAGVLFIVYTLLAPAEGRRVGVVREVTYRRPQQQW